MQDLATAILVLAPEGGDAGIADLTLDPKPLHCSDALVARSHMLRGRAALVLVDATRVPEWAVRQIKRLATPAAHTDTALLVTVTSEQGAWLAPAAEAGAVGHIMADQPAEVRHAALRFALNALRHRDAVSSEEPGDRHHLPGGLALWKWQRSTGKLTLSERTAQFIGVLPADDGWHADDFFDRVHPRDRQRLLHLVRRAFVAGVGFVAKVRLRAKSGAYVTVNHSVRVLRDAFGAVEALAATLAPGGVGEDAASESEIDRLTGLANHVGARAELDRLLGSHDDVQAGPAVLILSVSRFERLNFLLGRTQADEVLKAIAARLQTAMLRSGERDTLVCRLGGADFALILPGEVTAKDAEETAEQVINIFGQDFATEGGHHNLAVRVGIAVTGKETRDGETLLQHAYTALSEAKEYEPDTYRMYSPVYAEDRTTREAVERALAAALESDQLAVHYHPVIEVATREVVGFEALVRWHHPEHGLLMPESFVPIAEQSGLIAKLGDWVLRHSLTEAAQWRSNGHSAPTLSVNFSADQFRRHDVAARLLAMVESARFDPRRLVLELTETVVMEDIQRSAMVMQQIMAHGIRVAIDDFGTGYSSLSYLKHLPFCALKVDRLFIEDLPESAQSLAMLDAIVAMAKTLNMSVIAEGVEAEEQMECLARSGCDMVQGYLFAPPLPGEDVIALLGGHASD